MTQPEPGVTLDLLLTHRAWVRALARRLAADESRADDVEQETWLAAIEHPPRHATSLRAWLGEVVRNAARKSRRGEVRRTHHEAAAPAGRPARPGEDLVAEAELNHVVVRAVLDLEEPYRTTVLFRWFDGLPPREIAARMDVPVETVRTRLKRAHERLREVLDGRFDGDRRAWALLVLAWPGRSMPTPGTPYSPAPHALRAPLSTLSAGSIAGVLAMSALKKTVVALIVVALLSAAAWKVADPLGGGAEDRTSAPAVVEELQDTHRTPSRAARAGIVQFVAADDASSQTESGPGVVEVLVRTASGAPVEGAAVEAYPSPAAGASQPFAEVAARFATALSPAATARTGADGVARVHGIPLDRMTRVVARKSGFVPAAAWTQGRADGTPPRSEILLVAGHSLAGRVVTPSGTPVAGALVLAGGPGDRWSVNSGGSPLLARTTTGADGRFALADLERGSVILWAARKGSGALQVAVVLVPSGRDVELVLPDGASIAGFVRDASTNAGVAGATVAAWCQFGEGVFAVAATTAPDGSYRIDGVPVGANSLRSMWARAAGYVAIERTHAADVVLRPSEVASRDFSLRRGGVLTGVVRGGGAPVAGATVSAAWTGESSAQSVKTRTDAEGRYRFGEVQPGRAVIVVSAEGWLQEGFPPRWRTAVQAGAAPTAATVDVPASGTATLDVNLGRGVVVSGRVLLPDGGPAARASVRAVFQDSYESDGPWGSASARTADDGSFRITGVPPVPRVSVTASHAAFAPSETAGVDLPPDAAPAPVELRLQSPLVVRGVVTTPDGADAGDVWVEWTSWATTGDPSEDASTWASALRVPVDAGREFEFTVRQSGRTLALRAASSELPASPAVRATLDATTREQDVVLAFAPGRNAVGRVVDRDIGAAIAGARVRLAAISALPKEARAGRQPPLAPLVAVTSATGEFVLRDLYDGRFEARVDAQGHLPGALEFDVPVGASLDLALAPTRTLTGRAVWADGRPVPGVTVSCASPDWTGRSTTTDAAGAFAFTDLGDGPFGLWFSSQGSAQGTDPNVIQRSLQGVRPGTGPVEVVLEPGLAISGRVVDARGDGVAGSWVQCSRESLEGAPAGTQMSQMAWTRPDGTFVVRGLRAGRHTVTTAPLPGRGARQAGVPAVKTGVDTGTTGLVLVLAEGLAIEGVLLGADGRGLTGVILQAGPVDESMMNYAVVMGASADVGADGRFRITGLQAGRYRIRLFERGRPSALQIDDASAVVDTGAKGLRLVATSATTISGRVTLGPDAPLGNVSVSGTRVGAEREHLRGTSDSDGRFVLLGAKPGATYDLTTGMLGIVQGRARAVASGASGVHLRCETGCTARGRAVNARGEPVAKLLLWFQREADDSSSSCTTDDEGRFEVAGLVDAEHRVRFETFVKQEDGTRKREWRDCGAVRAGEDGAVLRIVE